MAENESIAPETLSLHDQEAYNVLMEFCEASHLNIRPTIRGVEKPYLNIELVGADAEVSFGRGPALDSLQYLSNLIISKRVGGETRVALDAAGYRQRRTDTLTRLAMDFAAQVKELQQECELDPLPPHERRIIHNALQEVDGIRTYSEGDEPDRRVVIAPR